MAMLLYVHNFCHDVLALCFNTYRGWFVLVFHAMSDLILSKEGVTQGDLLSVYVYAVGTYSATESVLHSAIIMVCQ